MRQLLFLVFLISMLFTSCSVDFNEFDKSGYRNLVYLSFEGQSGSTSLFTSEKLIKVSFPSDIKEDSLVIESLEISSLSNLYLVKSKVLEMPQDSLEMDSLAAEVILEKNALKEGSKIRLPQSREFYLVVVSESGLRTIWTVKVEIEGELIPNSSSSLSSSSSSVSSSSVYSSSSILSSSSQASSVDLKILMKEQVSDVVISGKNGSPDTIQIVMPLATDLSLSKLDTAIVHRKSTLAPAPSSIKDWSKKTSFTVTAENGDSKTWVVSLVRLKNSSTDFQVSFKNMLKRVVEAESGSILVKLTFGTDLATASLASFDIPEGALVLPKPDTVSSWTTPKSFTVTAENGSSKKWTVIVEEAESDEVVSSDKELLTISATGEVSKPTVDHESKTVLFHLASKAALSSVKLSVSVSAGASVSPASGSTIDLTSSKTLLITAEDLSSVSYAISADYPLSSAGEILSFVAEDPSSIKNALIDSKLKTVTLSFGAETDLSRVYFDAVYSPLASKVKPTTSFIDLSSGSTTLTIMAEDGSTVSWTVIASIVYPAPQIKSIRLAGQLAKIDQGTGRIIADNLAFLTDLTAVVVSEIEFSEGATSVSIESDGIYNLVSAKSVTVSTPDGQSKTYLVKAGYQYPNSDFNVWTNGDKDVEGGNWANGNNSAGTITSKYSDAFTGVKMESKKLGFLGITKFASGNLFTGVFNPKKATLIEMSGYANGNELIDFGKSFKGRPEFVEIDFTYDGKGDSCDFYVLLENRTSTKNDGLNQYRTSSDVNTLIASAWFRSTSDSDTSDPDVVSITTNSLGTKTLRMKLKYGNPLPNSPIFDSKTFSTKLENAKGIDNHLVQGTGQEEVTHIRIAMASSAKGDFYKGSVGAVLIVDELRLIY